MRIVGGLLLIMGLASVFGLGVLPATLLFGAGLFASNYLMLSGYLRDAARLRMVVTVVFGLIHGFGFAADLLARLLGRYRWLTYGGLLLVVGVALDMIVSDIPNVMDERCASQPGLLVLSHTKRTAHGHRHVGHDARMVP